MKFNTKRTILIGLAFFSICAFWQFYDNEIPKILKNTFGMKETMTGFIMSLDNILALFLLPLFGRWSDKTNTKIGKRMPFILVGTFLACGLLILLGQFTRNYTQTVKRAADNKRRYAPGWVHSTCLLRGFPKGAAPHWAHDFAEQSVVCYTLCRRCPENTVAAGEGKGI